MKTEIRIDEGFSFIKLENGLPEVETYRREVNSTFIQLHFCLKNSTKLHFGPHYALDIKENNSLLLYNPNQNLPINLSLNQNSKQIILMDCMDEQSLQQPQ